MDDTKTTQLDENLGPPAPVATPPGVEAETSIGDYQIVRQIAESSTSLIYKAQHAASKRNVVIKVLRDGPALAPNSLEHSKDEIDRLAHLRHPGLASFIEAGTTPQGRSYFVSEFVRGLPLNEYARMHKIPQKDRLAVFLKICNALNHAHQHCLLHRDLSPNKIILDGKGNPKILGLGVASLTGLDLKFPQEGWTQDDLKERLAYKSPEQAARKLFTVDVRSDVYALGAILYELLTDQLPYELSGASEQEIVRMICKEWPRKPSTVRSTISGDLEAIILKALHKDPTARYQNVVTFAKDLRNYLEKRPISARPAGAFYEFSKLAARYRSRFLSVAVMSAALVLFGIQVHLTTRRADHRLLQEQEARSAARIKQLETANQIAAQQRSAAKEKTGAEQQTQQTQQKEKQAQIADLQGNLSQVKGVVQRLQKQVDHAQAQTLRAQAMTRFVVGLFQGGDRPVADGPGLSAEKILDRGAAEIPARFKDLPRQQATLFNDFGLAYQNLGRHEKAAKLLRQALKTRRSTNGAADAGTIEVMNNLSAVLFSQHKFDQAEPLCRSIVKAATKLYGPKHAKTLTAMNNLALTLQSRGKLAEAERVLRKVVAGRRRVLGSDDRRTAMSIYNLGQVLADQGKNDQAEAPLREALTILPDGLSEGHWLVANVRSRLGGCLAKLERFDEAEPLLLKSYAALHRRLGDANPKTQAALDRIVSAYNAWGKQGEAAKWLAKLPPDRRSLNGANSSQKEQGR